MQKSGASRYVVLMPISLVRATATAPAAPRQSRLCPQSGTPDLVLMIVSGGDQL